MQALDDRRLVAEGFTTHRETLQGLRAAQYAL